MPDRCDICGLAALDTREFGEETLPFRKPKRYCPACRKRFQHRLYAVLMIVPVLFALGGILSASALQIRWFESIPFRLGLLMVFQWVMILPHEMGHAIVARAFGFPQVRILVGVGKPMVSFKLFGTPVLLSLLPVSGLMLFQHTEAQSRWKQFAMVAAGPLVNFAAVFVCWQWVPSSFLIRRFDAIISLFFWANVILLLSSLIPYHAETASGRTPSDGLLLWRLLFRWNKAEPSHLPLWELAFRRALKWCGVAITAAATLFFLVIAAIPFFPSSHAAGWEEKLILPFVMLLLASLAGWITVRISKEPISKVRLRKPAGREAIKWSQEQLQIIQNANSLCASRDFKKAEPALDELLATIPDQNSAAYVHILTVKLRCLVAQNEIVRAEQACLAFVKGAEGDEQKVQMLDSLASFILYQLDSPFLEAAERLARRGIEIAPGAATLKGTLGGILTEQGKYSEAEPLLQECIERGPALHDQGISSFYLGLIKLSKGQIAEGKRLIDRSTILHAEPWLLAKIKARGLSKGNSRARAGRKLKGLPGDY